MGKYKAAIFDLDGVIVDSGPVHLTAWKMVLKKHGFSFDDRTFRQNYGMRDAEVVPRLVGAVDDDTVTRWQQEKTAMFRHLIVNTATAVTGLIKFVNQLREHQIVTAVASSAPQSVVQAVLKTVGLAEKIQTVVTGEQTMRGKPAPDIFLMACYRLNLEPAQVVVFEDAVSGVEAARTAGTVVVAITTSHDRGELSHADLIIEDFLDAHLADLFW